MVDLETAKSSQDTPNGSQKEPERALKRSQNHLWVENVDFSENVRIPKVKSTFSRVGGSIRELKIDPKRLRGEIKKHIDAPEAIVSSKKRANEPSRFV